MKRSKIFLSFILLLTSLSFGQQYTKTEYGIKTKLQSVNVEIEFYSPAIVRLNKNTCCRQ